MKLHVVWSFVLGQIANVCIEWLRCKYVHLSCYCYCHPYAVSLVAVIHTSMIYLTFPGYCTFFATISTITVAASTVMRMMITTSTTSD